MQRWPTLFFNVVQSYLFDKIGIAVGKAGPRIKIVMFYVIAVVPTVEGGRGGFMYPRAIAALEGGVRQHKCEGERGSAQNANGKKRRGEEEDIR